MGKQSDPGGEKEFYSWAGYQADVEALAAEVRRLPHMPARVYGFPRGGLVVAVSLSHLLDVPMTLSPNEITADTLVVDDIADTGTTFERLCRRLGFRPIIATLYYNPRSAIVPDKFIRKKERWVVFPWETAASSRYDGTST